MAGYLPPGESSSAADLVHELYARAHELSDEEVLVLIDRCWQEFRRRRGLVPPGSRAASVSATNGDAPARR